jgi:hypothetical protein
MVNPVRKRSTLVVIVMVIVILSGALLIQFGGKIGSPVQSGTATFSSSSKGQTPELVGFFIEGDFSELPVTPSATMNYTITISQIDTTVNHVALSAVSAVPGVTAVFVPKEFTFLGAYQAVSLEISVDPAVSSPNLPIKLIATTPKGLTNSSF